MRAPAEQNKLVAESERLGNVLLNSISHELWTPLAAITGAASGWPTVSMVGYRVVELG